MRILELCEFSAGICGVWTRVKQEAEALAKSGFEVFVFSSNKVKGSDEIAKKYEKEALEIRRFPVKFQVGENALFWDFKKEALEIKPDLIIAHVYRHPHTNAALSIKKKLEKKGKRCAVFLVTHAPFLEEGLRSKKLEFFVKLYDLFFKKNLNKFDKIISITNWENEHLLKLGAKRDKITYLPNPVPNEFFERPVKKGKGILFFGRIAPVKSIETLIEACDILGDKIRTDIVGFAEKDYLEKLKKIVKGKGLEKVYFGDAVYDLNEKIKTIDQHEIFVLPSNREAMPQALIEAMARGKIVIASKTAGAKEIIRHGKNGFLFDIGDAKKLAELIEFCLDKRNKKKMESIRKNARKSAEKFKMSFFMKKLKGIL